MPLYVIERTFAEQLELSGEDVELIDEVNADEGVRWLFSFLSADRRRTYCLYEAPSPDAIVAAARRVRRRTRTDEFARSCASEHGDVTPARAGTSRRRRDPSFDEEEATAFAR